VAENDFFIIPRSALSNVETPASIRWKEEARKGRRRLYPTTVVYTAVSLAAMGLALRSNPRAAALVCALGVAFWTWVEYMVHRYILHGRFPDGRGLRHLPHKLFDHLHLEHHQRPWDGEHINGTLDDTMPFLGPAFLLSLLLPTHTLTAFLAGLAQAYVVEEWVHHSVHFYHFHNRYFRYIKRHHMYHHSPKGFDIAFGLTNGFWDVVFDTRIPAHVRAALYARRAANPGRCPRTA
jgi:sterol desaturase/sphingolipid hydroxylase (fatty acid hydroxylase superfamily)